MAAPKSCSMPTFDWILEQPDGRFSTSMPNAECSIWVWCRCSPYQEWDYCERTGDELSCSMDDICQPSCAGEGGWYLRCGDGCLGPPCFEGRFYGEVSIICRCPDEQEYGSEGGDTSWSLNPQPGEGSCGDDFPEGQPHPWEIPYGDFDLGGYVPQLIFPDEPCGEGARGVWTWCPCSDGSLSYPGLQDCVRVFGPGATPAAALGTYNESGTYGDKPAFTNGSWWIWFAEGEDGDPDEWLISSTKGDASAEAWLLADAYPDCPIGEYTILLNGASGVVEVLPCCPDDGTNCQQGAIGDGEWVFRGGCIELGPPPVQGRFYGETIMTGHCCGSYSSFSDISESSFSEISNSSCSMPNVPLYWWDLVLYDDPPWNQVLDQDLDDGGIATGEACMMSDSCSAWVWCQCERDMEPPNCEQEWGDDTCPYVPGEVDASDGEWVHYGGDDHHGPPCITGRFYGEIIWFCQCEKSSSSSVSSRSCSCGAGGYALTCDAPGCDPDISGNYTIDGFHDGMPRYKQCYGDWYLCYTDYAAGWGRWSFTKNADCSDSTDGFHSDDLSSSLYWPDDPTLTWNTRGSATGTFTLSCCHECSCASCCDPLTVTISGLSGWCAAVNGTFTNVALTNPDSETCYYYHSWVPGSGDCLQAWLIIECRCGVWYASVGGISCKKTFPNQYYYNPTWVSDPVESTDCPPEITWTMNIVNEGCDPTGQIPTVTTQCTPIVTP